MPEKYEKKPTVRAFARTVREILVQYEKPMLEFNSHLRKIYFIATVKEKKAQSEKRNIKRKLNKEVQSKIVDNRAQLKFNDYLICAIEKFEKSKKWKDECKKEKKIGRFSMQ